MPGKANIHRATSLLRRIAVVKRRLHPAERLLRPRHAVHHTATPTSHSPLRTRGVARRTRAAIIAIVIVGAGIWIVSRYGYLVVAKSTTSVLPKYSIPDQTKSSALQGPQGPNTIAKSTQRAGIVTSTKREASPGSSLLVYPPDDPQVPYFTVGSTKDDVVRVQGAPTRSTNTRLSYGLSEVYLKDGRVQSWKMNPSSPLKARMPE